MTAVGNVLYSGATFHNGLAFLRRCPACGRRLTVSLRGESLVKREEHHEHIMQDRVAMTSDWFGGGAVHAEATYDDVPIESHLYSLTFESSACHHRWTENVTRTQNGR